MFYVGPRGELGAGGLYAHERCPVTEHASPHAYVHASERYFVEPPHCYPAPYCAGDGRVIYPCNGSMRSATWADPRKDAATALAEVPIRVPKKNPRRLSPYRQMVHLPFCRWCPLPATSCADKAQARTEATERSAGGDILRLACVPRLSLRSAPESRDRETADKRAWKQVVAIL